MIARLGIASWAAALVLSACCSSPPRFGSWTQVVKSADVGSSADDPDKTVQVLEDTNQSFIIYSVDSEEEWTDFLDLLYAVGSKDIDVYAAVDAPHLSHVGTRLFELAGVTEPDCECKDASGAYLTGLAFYDCKRTCIRTWLQGWIAAAEEVSQYAALYPSLKGFVINDFDGYVESIDHPACRYGDRLTRGEVALIRTAVRSIDPDLEFWPVCYPSGFGRVIGHGYVLGANHGVKVFPEDTMSVTLSFNLVNVPSLAYLQFMHADTVTTESDGSPSCLLYNMLKRVLVNGTLVWSESMAGDQSVQRFEQDIAGLLTAGANTVELRLESALTTASNGCDVPYWRCWDVGLKLVNASAASPYFSSTFAALTPTYSVASDLTAYLPTTGCYGAWRATELDADGKVTNDVARCAAALPDSETTGRGNSQLIAAPNTGFLIHDVIDGIVAPWYSTDRPSLEKLLANSCSSGPVWPPDGSIETFRELLAGAADSLGRSRLMMLHWGIPVGDSEFNLDIQREQIQAAADIAGHVGIWNMANGVQLLPTNEGVFAERTDFVAAWPGRQSSLPGWYQRWTSPPALVGSTLTVTVTDTRDADPAAEGLVVWRVYDVTSGLIEEVDVSVSAIGVATEVEATVTGGLVLEVALVGGVGNWLVTVTFEVKNAAGAVLPGTLWTFASGVDDEVLRAFEVQRSVFLSEPRP